MYIGFWWRKPEGKRPLERCRRRWEDNIKMDLQEVGCGNLEWIELAWDKNRWRSVVNAVMNLRVPYNLGNFLTSCRTGQLPNKNSAPWGKEVRYRHFPEGPEESHTELRISCLQGEFEAGISKIRPQISSYQKHTALFFRHFRSAAYVRSTHAESCHRSVDGNLLWLNRPSHLDLYSEVPREYL